MSSEIKFVSKRKPPISMWIIAAGIGFLLSLPISGIGKTENQAGIVPSTENMTANRAVERDIQLLRDELDTERRETAIIEKALMDEKTYSQDLLQTVQRYRELSGMTDLVGAGIIIRISDAMETVPGTEMVPVIIHQEDLLDIINELWHNDAEAIAIGSPTNSGKFERITNFSPFRCSGGAIEVNDRRMVPPFEIRAIGDPELLKTVMTMRGSYIERLNQLGITTSVDTSESVFIPKYNGTTHWLYARSILTEGGIVLEDESDQGDNE